MIRRFLRRLPSGLRTMLFLLFLAIGTTLLLFLVTEFGFRSYVVRGPSMEPTLKSGELLLVNKLGRTTSWLSAHPYLPKRNELVVFANPLYGAGESEKFIVKRVVGLPGDRVQVQNGRITITPTTQPTPAAFNPDTGIEGIQQPTSGSVDRVVPPDELFVAGDNRLGNNSLDSRNGLSTIRLQELQGNVVVRLFPPTKLRLF